MGDDIKYMKRVLELAMRGMGYVSPNPLVGSVIVKNNEIIGEGWHKRFGGSHAEIEAINNSKLSDFDGATLYVNLEPCVHEGKTPPCAPVIAEKRFSRVVIGMLDPNPRVCGKGILYLKEKGIEVTTGVSENDCRWLNRFFTKHITTGRPYIIAKAAQTLDGFIATSVGDSKWISCEESRLRSHILRASVDAVLIGKGTAMIDNPSLTVRHIKGRNPRRVILDTHLSLPSGHNLFSDEYRKNTIVCCSEAASNSVKARVLSGSGVKIMPIQTDESGLLDISNILYELYHQLNIASILVEGGSEVLSSFARKKAIDEMQLFISPKIFGAGKKAFNDFGIQSIEKAINMQIHSVMKSGGDIHLIAIKS